MRERVETEINKERHRDRVGKRMKRVMEREGEDIENERQREKKE